MRLPDFLIIGEMKCGTTTLWELITRDDRIFSQQQKELHFFGSYSYFGAAGSMWPGGLEEYAANFATASRDQLVGEATPNYLSDPLAFKRIKEVIPRVRLIVILRDPVERAWSHYWHQVTRGWERLSFEDAVRAEVDRLTEGYDSRERYSYITRGRYAEHLGWFEQEFSREQLCVILFDQLLRNPKGTFKKVSQHLGLDPVFAGEFALPHRNRSNFPRWPGLDRCTRRTMSWADQSTGPIQKAAQILAKLSRPLRTYSGVPRIREQTHQRLMETFSEGDRALSKWLGKPVPWRDRSNSSC